MNQHPTDPNARRDVWQTIEPVGTTTTHACGHRTVDMRWDFGGEHVHVLGEVNSHGW